MIHLFDFTPQKTKPAADFAKNPDGVPKTWGGYIALFEPGKAPKETKFWSAYWFANKNGKTIKKAKIIRKNGQ